MGAQGRPNDRFAIFGCFGAVVLAVIAWRMLRTDTTPPDVEESRFPLAPYTDSPFLNTGPNAQYIGVVGCTECHRPEHLSYLHTEHSRALGDIDVREEPADGTFFHKLSGRSYRVYRDGNTMRHEEVIRSEGGKEIARVDAPIRYRIGSGNFTRSYIVEIDGFLHESPITWYAQKRQWAMSPGYDFAQHVSFERPITHQCLACHAGQVQPIGDSVSRMRISEKSIGCESCHGPGSLHRDRHASRSHKPGEADPTIVHPGRLPRSLLESICANCHQSEAASILLRGRDYSDFRPGRPLTDYRIDYRFESSSEKMTVVGHMEQLRRSSCYQKSGALNCLTCHDPHLREKPSDPVAYHRQKCMKCHDSLACQVDPAKRAAKADNCMSCHMPRGDTDIPHIAFTHHRIGKHPTASQPRTGGPPRLVPIDDVSTVPELDRQRSLGLAYAILSQQHDHDVDAELFRRRALELLEPLHEQGLRQDEISYALFSLLRKSDPLRALEFGREAAMGKSVPPVSRAPALTHVALDSMKSGDLETAAEKLNELTAMRRGSNEQMMLADLHLRRNEPEQAVAALRKALAIRPFRAPIHLALAEAYGRLGDNVRAKEHLEKGNWLAEHGLY